MVHIDDRAALGRVPDIGSLPVVVIGVGGNDDLADPPSIFDVILGDGDPMLDAVVATVERNPIASAALAVLLRASALLPIDHALAAESAVYSLLQSGPEFAAWRAGNTHRPASPTDEPAVVAWRDDTTLEIVLNRPERHNAFSRAMRDGLHELLALAVADGSIEHVVLRGNGPSFCSGGDLGEFGSFGDPATAHLTRLTRSPARLVARLARTTEVQLHGACMGAGIELAAFARRVVADPDSEIALPEIGLGLIPGSGGTVSITRRLGRQRCALLALCGTSIDARTAAEWGLIDSISPTTAAASLP
ncbi:MAG: enoyl-CoA hydratase/isomerase family protein [Ilumatobacteraceae bacterium]|nr:enoyl-CoA hydratase/isomerase family protein [Ilumatobacteraceae bacterium]